MKDNVELSGDVQLDATMQNETTRVYKVVYNVSCSIVILVKNPLKIICWIRYFLSTNMAGVSVDDILSYQIPKFRWLMI